MGGEVTTKAAVDFGGVARRVYRDVGYEDAPILHVNVARQSPDIAQGVDTGGAGDQGIMYGYATNETPTFLPSGIPLVHALVRGLWELRQSCAIPWLRPDGKAQVTMEQRQVRTVLVSCQHDEHISQDEVREALTRLLIHPLLGDRRDVEILINPTGKFVLGGFAADTGLTGRKLMVDSYGGLIPHGGGCFSGKDPSKVDRSAAYMARFAAKNIVASGGALQCLVSVAYAIGREEPLMVHAVDESGKDISSMVRERFDFRPRAIIERLGLRRPLYRHTATYGHFGREGLPWEEIIA